jgi:hypothetical protein
MSSIGRGANASRDCDAFDLFFSFLFALVCGFDDELFL